MKPDETPEFSISEIHIIMVLYRRAIGEKTSNSALEQNLLLLVLISLNFRNRHQTSTGRMLTETTLVEAPPFHRTHPERYLLVLSVLLRKRRGGVHQRSQRLTTPEKVCMFMYIYIYIHIYIYICTHVYKQYIHIYIHTYIYTNVCM